jgi:hypothetical protein
MRLRPGAYQEGQLRTFHRRVKAWRALHGPDKEVFFPQDHVPGEAIQTDFTWATELGVTIQGEPFTHMLCHVVLPYSNWDWATVCQSESMLALRRGIPAALVQLGRVPKFSQTDNSTAATHRIVAETGEEVPLEVEGDGGPVETHGRKPRAYNDEYIDLVRHYDMLPRTIAVGKSEQNGDIEAANGALKRRLYQHLLLRGHRDFPSVEAWEAWVQEVCRKANARRPGVEEELAAMRPLKVEAFLEFDELTVKVTDESCLVVKRNTYSVPPRLVGEKVRVRLYEMRLEVWYSGQCVLVLPRLLGECRHHIDYRHVARPMLLKANAFARYRYRESLIPSPVWHQALETLKEGLGERKGEVAYLRNLVLAAENMECEVEAALELLMEAGTLPEPEQVKQLMGLQQPKEAVDLQPLVPNLAEFDALCAEMAVAG